MNRITTLFAVFLFVLPVVTGTVAKGRAKVEPEPLAGQSTKVSPQNAATIFDKVKSDLVNKTDVPLRLPTFLPEAGDAQNPLYASIQNSNRMSYSVELGWVENCNGGNACHYGTVRGSSTPLVENEGARVPVKLHGGITGYFIHSTCGAHCDDSAIGWAEGSYNYSISIKAADMKSLISVANSSIVAHDQQNHR